MPSRRLSQAERRKQQSSFRKQYQTKVAKPIEIPVAKSSITSHIYIPELGLVDCSRSAHIASDPNIIFRSDIYFADRDYVQAVELEPKLFWQLDYETANRICPQIIRKLHNLQASKLNDTNLELYVYAKHPHIRTIPVERWSVKILVHQALHYHLDAATLQHVNGETAIQMIQEYPACISQLGVLLENFSVVDWYSIVYQLPKFLQYMPSWFQTELLICYCLQHGATIEHVAVNKRTDSVWYLAIKTNIPSIIQAPYNVAEKVVISNPDLIHWACLNADFFTRYAVGKDFTLDTTILVRLWPKLRDNLDFERIFLDSIQKTKWKNTWGFLNIGLDFPAAMDLFVRQYKESR